MNMYESKDMLYKILIKYNTSPILIYNVLNPKLRKRAGKLTRTYQRYQQYKNASTPDEFFVLGGTFADIITDYERGYLNIEGTELSQEEVLCLKVIRGTYQDFVNQSKEKVCKKRKSKSILEESKGCCKFGVSRNSRQSLVALALCKRCITIGEENALTRIGITTKLYPHLPQYCDDHSYYEQHFNNRQLKTVKKSTSKKIQNYRRYFSIYDDCE